MKNITTASRLIAVHLRLSTSVALGGQTRHVALLMGGQFPSTNPDHAAPNASFVHTTTNQ